MSIEFNSTATQLCFVNSINIKKYDEYTAQKKTLTENCFTKDAKKYHFSKSILFPNLEGFHPFSAVMLQNKIALASGQKFALDFENTFLKRI